MPQLRSKVARWPLPTNRTREMESYGRVVRGTVPVISGDVQVTG